MPGSNEYSINPELKTGASTEQLTKAPVHGNPVLLPYKPRNFEEVRAREMYGTEMDRRDNRRFKRYLKSAQGMVDAAHFEASEKARAQAANDYATQQNVARLQSKNPISTTPISAPVKVAEVTPRTETKPSSAQRIKPTVDWNSIAQQNGFADMEAVRQWQLKNGLVADGKFGKNSKAKWDSLKQQSSVVVNKQPSQEVLPNSVSNTNVKEPAKFNLAQFAKNNGLQITKQMNRDLVRWDPDGFGDFWVDSEGNIYEGGTLFDSTRTVNLSSGLGYGQRKSRYEALQNAISGVDNSTGLAGLKIDENSNQRKSITRTAPYRTLYKQGGTMNRINYFQQGGAAPQQDIKAQVTALVQAAMQGDQKATQQVNQIMEAAKAGDKQAMQIAQIMEQVVKELQGQATSAKWGAKLGYIKSLKYAKGGKTCPACKNGGIPETADKAYIKSTKKVEEKACGGKAKKKYFGGLI